MCTIYSLNPFLTLRIFSTFFTIQKWAAPTAHGVDDGVADDALILSLNEQRDIMNEMDLSESRVSIVDALRACRSPSRKVI